MTNLEAAKKMINDDFDGVMNHHKVAHNAVELAATPDWKYPEKNEFPKDKQRVLCVFKETNMVQEDIFFRVNIDYFKKLYIAWCKLPVFNEK